jgi:hypothetical protein
MQRREGLMVQQKLRVIRSFDSDGDIAREIWYYWDGESRTFLPDSKDYFFYHSIVASNQEEGLPPVRIYPNPTRGILNITGLTKPAEVKIYSMQGMLLRRNPGSGTSVDLSDFSPGSYLIFVSEAGNSLLRTILIKE